MATHLTLTRMPSLSVTITEAPSEKGVMKILIAQQNVLETETLVAVPRDEALQLL